LIALAAQARAQPADAPPRPQVLSVQEAVRYALENNPALAAQRQQRGIAAARVVIAETYPFNPVLENRIQGAEGPQSGGITNRVPVEHILVWEVELLHQGRYRRQEAAAALSRTEWEITYQEQTLAVQVIRTYSTLLYRLEKLWLLEETLRFNRQLVADVSELIKAGKLRNPDRIVAETEVNDTLDLLETARGPLTDARQDLYRLLGMVGAAFEVAGSLDLRPQTWDAAALTEMALTRRADLRARREAVAETAAAVRLALANRYGNPSVGPAYTYDPSGVNSFGVQLNVPLPIVNTRRGEVLQSEAEQAQAALLLRQAEVNVRQDVIAALARLDVAERRADVFRSRILPDLRRALEGMETLFKAGDPGVDLLRVIDVRRKLLRARDGYLDALWGVSQARSELLAAVGEPVVGLSDSPPPHH
jgi:cobalt-zinc-cadmium efflux system outer membrane protein